MDDFEFQENTDFRLTDQEGKTNLKRAAMVGLYLLLAIVVMVTGAHAVMLVISQAPAALEGESGLLTAVLNAIRIAFPVTVELAAVVAGLGFIGAKWRKGQKSTAFGIELVWVIFAAANMITFFRVERGLPLESWQLNWVNYGLPLSALIAGVLTYSLTRTDPDLKRKDEETAAEEKIKMIQFAARRDVAISAQRQAIEKQRAWIDFVKKLKTQGYSDLQIRFILQDTPELLIDQDKNGNLDLLEDGSQHTAVSPSQAKELDGRQIAEEFNAIPTHPTPRPSVNGSPNGSQSRRLYITKQGMGVKLRRRKDAGTAATEPTGPSSGGWLE